MKNITSNVIVVDERNLEWCKWWYYDIFMWMVRICRNKSSDVIQHSIYIYIYIYIYELKGRS